MATTSTTICVRCGKQRIFLSVSKEKNGTSVVTITETTCPDLDCQKKVDQMLNSEYEKRQQSIVLKKERIIASHPAKVQA